MLNVLQVYQKKRGQLHFNWAMKRKKHQCKGSFCQTNQWFLLIHQYKTIFLIQGILIYLHQYFFYSCLKICDNFNFVFQANPNAKTKVRMQRNGAIFSLAESDRSLPLRCRKKAAHWQPIISRQIKLATLLLQGVKNQWPPQVPRTTEKVCSIYINARLR